METESKYFTRSWTNPRTGKVNPLQWVKSNFSEIQSDKYESPIIHVGTDSQRIRKGKYGFVYVIAIEFSRGARYIYLRDVQFPKARPTRQERLSQEVYATMEIATKLRDEFPTLPIEVDFDLNSDVEYESNKVVPMATGYATGLGFKFNIKPNNQVATRAADSQVRRL